MLALNVFMRALRAPSPIFIFIFMSPLTLPRPPALLLRTAHFSIPIVGPEFKEVTYAEDSGAIAAQVVEQKRAAGRAWLHWHKRSLDQGQEQQRATQVRIW